MTNASRPSPRPASSRVGDLRPLAERRVPRVVFDYLDGGAEGEVTLRENCRAFEDVAFRPRHAVASARLRAARRACSASTCRFPPCSRRSATAA